MCKSFSKIDIGKDKEHSCWFLMERRMSFYGLLINYSDREPSIRVQWIVKFWGSVSSEAVKGY